MSQCGETEISVLQSLYDWTLKSLAVSVVGLLQFLDSLKHPLVVFLFLCFLLCLFFGYSSFFFCFHALLYVYSLCFWVVPFFRFNEFFSLFKKIKINVNLVVDWLRRCHIIDGVNQTPYHTMFRKGIHAAILTVQKLVKQKIVICLGWSTKQKYQWFIHQSSQKTLLLSNTWIK